MVGDLKLKIVKEFKLTDLMLIKIFDCNEILEVLIIGDHFDKIFYFLKLRPLFFKRFDNCQEFLVINLVIVFDWNIFGRKENDKVESFYQIILKEYIFQSPIRNIGFNDCSSTKIEKSEDSGNNKD